MKKKEGNFCYKIPQKMKETKFTPKNHSKIIRNKHSNQINSRKINKKKNSKL